MKVQNIKRCLCGGKAEVRTRRECFGHGDFAERTYVECTACHAKSKDVYDRDTVKEDIIPKAIKFWNRQNQTIPILKKTSAYLLVWICSGISFSAHQEENTILGIISSLISLVYFLWVK